MQDTGTRTPVLSITPVEEDDELGDLLNKKTPTKDIITTMQQNIRDSLHPKGDHLAALHDTASKIGLPARSSRLPAARKKTTSVSNPGESSDIEEDEDEAKKSRKGRRTKDTMGR